MSTLLKAMVAAGLALALIGTAHAVVLDPSLPIPPGSPRTDIGTPGDPAIPGYAQPFVGSILVAGGGSNIGGTADHGFFLYEELAGNGSISAQVQSFFSGTSPERMAGVMIRDSLDAGAANAASFILPTDLTVFPNVKRAQAQARTVASGGTTIIAPAPGDTPGVADFIQVTRAGDVFTFAWSPTGLPGTWVDYSSPVTVRMVGTIYVGLAVTSRNNVETATARVRNTTITGFGTATLLTWDEFGDDTWNSLSWLPPGKTPDNTTYVLLDWTNTNRVTVTADAESLDLTVKGGTLAIGAGRTLKVYGAVDFQANGYLEMANGSKLITNAGGTIENLVNTVGDSTIDTLGDMGIKNFGANLFAPGTFTKAGPGTLQLDNSSGVVIAPNTTFKISQGMLASKGVDPLGGADAVILQGTTLKLQNAGAINTATALVLPASSTLVVDDAPTASLGPLTLGAGTTLTTSGTGGGVGFASTGISFAGPGAVTFNTLINTGTGPINLGADLVTITKTGAAKLIVSGGGVGNAAFVVNQGALVGVAGSNPFGAAPITLSGGELILANNGLDNPALFDNAVTVTASSTLTGGKGGLTVGGPPSVRLGSALKGLTVNSGQTLTVQTTDGYTLDIAGALAGTGTMTMTGETGKIVSLSGGGTLGRVNVNGPGTLNMTSPLAIADVRVVGGKLNTSAVLTASTRLRSTGGETYIGDVLNATTLDVQGGVVNTAAVVNATTVLASGGTVNTGGVVNANAVTMSGGTVNTGAVANANNVTMSGGLLTMGANLNVANMMVGAGGTANTGASQVVASNSLTLSRAVFTLNSGNPFLAKGSNLSSTVAARTITLPGSSLTISGPPLVTKNLFLDSFNSTAAGDKANGIYQSAGGDPRRMRVAPNREVVIPGYVGNWDTIWNQNGGTGSSTSNSVSRPGDLSFTAVGYSPAGVVGQEGQVVYARDDNNMNLGRGLALGESGLFEYWFSGMMYVFNADNNDYGEFMLNFGPSATSPTKRVAFGFTADDDMYVRTANKSATAANAFPKGITHLIIGRVEVDPAGPEVVTYYLDPTDVSSLSKLASTAARTLSVTDDFIAAGDKVIQFRFQGRADTHVGPVDGRDYDQGVFLDEIRIASGLPGVVTGGRGAVTPNLVSLDLPNTNIAVTGGNSTLTVNGDQLAKLGNLAVDSGLKLTLNSPAASVSFGNLTAGDGASIIGNLTVRDDLSVGSSPGVLDVVGNLTLAGTSVYAWELDSMASDLINVSGKLTLKDGWTLKIVTSEPFDHGQHLLFTYGTSVAPSAPEFDLSEAPGWSPGALELDVDMAGNVFLIVPEPATWAMLLAAGVAGLIYARRRRQAA